MERDYGDLTGKKVNVTIEGEVHEGTVEAGSPIGIVFKPKGTSQTKLIEAASIQSIEEVVPSPKKLRARTIPRVTDGKHREHLIERHGYRVSEIQELTEEAAKEFHEGLDHSDLGHKHRELTEAEQAIREASADEPDEAA